MEDSLNYMNAVSEASQALNQVMALKEQANMLFEQKKETLGGEIELPAELSITGFGGYLGKKALGFVSEKIGEAVKPLGISEDTVGKALSGDISGAVEQGASEVAQTVQPVIEGVVSEAQGMISGVVEEGTGILGKVTSGLDNIGSIDLPSISSEMDIGNIYSQGLEDLKAQMNISDSEFNQYTNISLNDIKMPSFNNVSQAGQEVEMTDFSTIGSSEVSTEATAVADTIGDGIISEGLESVGTTVAETAGEVAGIEAIGAGIDITGVLAPVGAILGLVGGLIGFFEGKKTEEETPSSIAIPVLNPSAQFL